MNDNRAQFEKYYELYQNGDYLIYTDSLSQETALVNELFDAYRKVADFPEYLDSVVTAKNTLSGISVFGDTETDSFSGRNIIKSARDYAILHETRTSWQVDKGIVIAISAWRKNEMQALLFGLLLLVMPLVLRLMGFDFAGWFSTYPIYKGLMLFR